MHTKPMAESEGNFKDEWDAIPGYSCPGCKVAGKVHYRVWKSSCGGYEDYQYECRACGKRWWVDGIDS